MKANYYFQINEGYRAITLAPCNAFQAVRLYNYFADGLSLLKEVSGVTSIELYRVGEGLPKRILI